MANLNPLDTMTIEEVAQVLHLSPKYVRDYWTTVLPGIRPVKPYANFRRLLFPRQKVQELLAQPK